MSEDCLFLNIWTPYLPSPSSSSKKLKPVIFYIYGGGFTSGTSSNPNTDGTNLASRGDVVVVELNYRVGYFGFLAYTDGIHNGNYGIGDMVSALEWVRQNIASFGGNPDQVTISGESAGAAAVRALLASPRARGLFGNAILSSTPDGWTSDVDDEYMSISQYAAIYTNSALKSTGCFNVTDPIGCLSAVDASVLATLQEAAQFPVVDGVYLVTAELLLNDTSGHTSNISIMVGGDRDEVGIMAPYPTEIPIPNITLAEYFSVLAAEIPQLSTIPILSPNGTALFSIPANQANLTADQIFNIAVHVGSDGLYNCLLEATAYMAAKHGAFKAVYAYQFNRTYSMDGYTNQWCSAPITAAHPYGDPDLEYLKCHAGEQLNTFGNVKLRNEDRDGLDVFFAQWVVDQIASFVWSGNPNPEMEMLEVRGYESTKERVERTGVWEEVGEGRAWWLMQWDGFMVGEWPEREHCTFLGLPLDYFESR